MLLASFSQRWGGVVIGYPGGTIESKDEVVLENVVSLTHNFRPLIQITAAIPFDSWPTKGLSTRPRSDEDDVFFHFDKKAKIERLRFEETRTQTSEEFHDDFEFRGISGGGMWLDNRPTDDQVWHPRPKLIGVQSSISRSGQWLRGTSIDVWLQLIADEYPDLHDEVQRIRTLRQK